MSRAEAAVQVLCALIANQCIMVRLPNSGSGEHERLAEAAFAFVDAVEAADYEYQDDDEPEAIDEPVSAIDEPDDDLGPDDDDAAE